MLEAEIQGVVAALATDVSHLRRWSRARRRPHGEGSRQDPIWSCESLSVFTYNVKRYMLYL